MDEQYESDFKHYIDTLKKQNHDIVHHLIATKNMIDNEKYTECRNYLNDVLEECSTVSELLPLYSSAISGLLLGYKEKAAKEGITINFIITDSLKDIPFKIYEVNKILGNLIVNALDEVKKINNKEERLIYVKISKKDNFYKIEVGNFGDIETFNNVIDKIMISGFSTKKGIIERGFGLTIIQEIVDKYNGYLYPEIIDQLIIFNIKIPKEQLWKK